MIVIINNSKDAIQIDTNDGSVLLNEGQKGRFTNNKLFIEDSKLDPETANYQVIDWCIDRLLYIIKWFKPKKWITFTYKGNVIQSNKTKKEVLRTFWKDYNYPVTVIYADKSTKFFAPVSWKIHGKAIMQNRKKIKVVI